MKRASILLLPSVLLAFASADARGAVQVAITDINPDRSTLADADGATGGRVSGMARDALDRNTYYAASEWGGLFKSTDGGATWGHLDGHVPTATWDVEVDPTDSSRVYATSFFDGRVDSRAGINVSTDGGATWTHPASAVPPAGFCMEDSRRTEPSAFGIAVDSASPRDVYVGTSCGLAISNDRGVTWRFVDPTPRDGADNVWDVVVHHGGIIDLCGDDGHRRSADGGASWTTASSNALPSGRCSIAASPDESYVLFAVTGTTIFESDNGGGSWPTTFANPRPQGRIPFVATNQRSGRGFDLWFGDVQLHRGSCVTPTPAASGGAPRCPASTTWAGPFTRSRGAHDDSGDIAFDPGARIDACPVLFSSDGGVFQNTLSDSPGCHDPVWQEPQVTPHALWHFDFTGVNRPGADTEHLYFGNQDNGSFGSLDGGGADPSWINERCCDGFDVAADATRALNTICCFGGGRSTRLFVSPPGLGNVNPPEINTYPDAGGLLSFDQLDSIATFGPDDYVVVTRLSAGGRGVFLTDDVGASPIVWTQIGAASTPITACGIQVAAAGGQTSFFIKNGGCNGEAGGTLWRYDGIAPGGTWQQVTRPGGGSFGVYAVDPNDPDRILAADLGGGGDPEMVATRDGGAGWTSLAALDNLMTGGGVFAYANVRGPTRFTGFGGYVQPTLLAVDPHDPEILVAGAADAGVFLSLDGGQSWDRVTDPISPGTSGVPHIPRPRYAHFDHYSIFGDVNLYVGTQGRGAWRLAFRKPLPFYQYAAKMVCGVQQDAKDTRLAQGLYATTLNIHNSTYETVDFEWKVALTYPPRTRRAGEVVALPTARLGPDEALKLDCSDPLFQGPLNPTSTTPYWEGFVVVQSPVPFDVVGVYTTSALEPVAPSGYRLTGHSSIDVEPVPERLIEDGGPPPPGDGDDEEGCADLVVRDIGRPSVSCPTGAGSCVTQVQVELANVGDAAAGAFNARTVLDPGQSVVVTTPVAGGLGAGLGHSFLVETPPGGNCFDPDCTICVTADSGDAVAECDEENNRRCETTGG